MSRLTLLLILVASLFPDRTTRSAEQDSPAEKPSGLTEKTSDPATDRTEVRNVFFLAGDVLLFVRLRIRIDGKSFRVAIAEKIFSTFDRDGNRLLDKNEQQALQNLDVPESGESNSGNEVLSPIAAAQKAIETDASGTAITESQFRQRFLRLAHDLFQLARKRQPPARSVELFARLDANGDDRLSPDEMSRGRSVLAKLDLDEDETWSVAELLAASNQRRSQEDEFETSNQVSPDLIVLGSRTPAAFVANRIMKRYGERSQNRVGPRVSAESLGCEPEALKELDADSDGFLNLSELVRFVHDAKPRLEVTVEFAGRKRTRPTLRIAKTAPFSKTSLWKTEVDRVRNDRVTLSHGAASVELRVKESRTAAYDNRQFYKLRFRVVDADKNQYLGEEEFAAVGLANASFKMVDRDGDGKIFVDELVAYVDRNALASGSRVVMTIASDGKSLFQILDANSDRRITLRELQAAAGRLAAFDRNQDGLLASAELRSRFRLTVELGKPQLFQTEAAMSEAQLPTTPIIPQDLAGPAWFQKMDRNRDGDVSRREFLGSRTAFERVDKDKDGLISTEEAEALEKSQPR